MSDLISREAAIEAMEQTYCDIERVKKRPVTKGEQAIFMDMRGVIRSLPSVEPERKTGMWIKRRYIHSDKIIDMKICSECGYEFSYDAETGISNANGCPNCLADMRCDAKMEEDV